MVDGRHKLFRRRDVATRPYYVPRAFSGAPEPYIDSEPRKAPDVPEQDNSQIGRELLIEHYGPPSILVSQDGDPLHFFGDVSRFVRLGSASGKVDLNLLSIIDPNLRAELRVLLHRAARDHKSQYGQLHGKKDTGRAVRIAVHPVAPSRAEERLYLVSFEEKDTAPFPAAVSPDKLDDTVAQQILALEQDLKAAKENLQTVVEELETSNEELQSTNEELQASNEELQASNEELETANEELQATNEELTTVNDELSVKTNDLAEANSELEGIMANSAEGIVLIDPMLRILRSNEKAVRILQLSIGLETVRLTDVAAFEDAPSAHLAVENALKSGMAHAEEIRLQSRRYLMQVSAHRLDKRVTGAILTLSDITDLRRAELAAAEQGQRARSLMENSTDGIIIAKGRGLIHACNQAACDLLDMRDSDITGNRVDRLFLHHDINIRPLIQHLNDDEPADAPKRFEVTLVRRNRPRHFDVMLSDFTVEGETYNAATLREITELHEARESLSEAKQIAEQLNAAKTNFLTKFSHELRTPLNAIVGFSDAILNHIHGRLEHEKYLAYIVDIHSSGIHLLGLINDVFDIAKIEAGLLRLNEEPIDLVNLISSAISFVGPLSSKAGVTVVFDLKAPAVDVRCDELRIRQVLLNVLSNAIKFSHKGGKVRVTVRSRDRSLAVEVADKGVGIEKQVIERISTELVAPAIVRSSDKEGSGLGLPVSIALMKAHGGALHIDSAVGKGTIVTLCFPPDRVLSSASVKPNGKDKDHPRQPKTAAKRTSKRGEVGAQSRS
ncbi:MAG: ATP-binding protein [Xanthobacteraceae bacterium]